MEKSDLKVGQLFMYSTECSYVPCRVVEIGEDGFTLKLFEVDVDVHSMYHKGDKLILHLSFDKLDYKYDPQEHWKDIGFVRPSTQEEILTYYTSRVRNAENKLVEAGHEVQRAQEEVFSAEDLLVQVRAIVSD